MRILLSRALRKAFATAALVLAAPLCVAEWALEGDESTLGFVSVKNGTIVEGHRFRRLVGTVDEDGARLIVDLTSVDTVIEIRDARMQELLFEVAEFPRAMFTADIDASVVEDLAVGESRQMDVAGSLELHGRSQPLTASVLVTRVGPERIVVASTRPVVISAAAFALGAGVERLREIAGLNAITPMVPVSFSLSFRND